MMKKSSTPAPLAPAHDRDYAAHLGTIDATPGRTLPFTVELFPEPIYEHGTRDGWRDWQSRLEYNGPGLCFELEVTRRRKHPFERVAEQPAQIVGVQLESLEEAQYLGELILATVAKMRRTAERHAIPLLLEEAEPQS